MTGSRIVYFFTLLCAVLFLIFYIGYFSMFLILFLLCLPLCSFLLMLPVHGKLTCSFVDPDIATQCGETAMFQLCIQSHSRVPMGQILVRYTCINTLTGEHFRQRLHFPAPVGTETVQLPVQSPYCGRLNLMIEKIAVCDLFGLFRWKCQMPQKQAFAMVLPNLLNLQISAVPETDPGGESTEYDLHRPGNDASETFAVREYQPGDRLNCIHWKLSEKRSSVMVREGSLPLPAGPDILLELQEASPAVLSCAAETALALSSALLTSGQRYRLLWLNGGELRTVSIESEDTAVQAANGLLSAQPQKAAIALASFEPEAFRQLLYVTSGDVPSSLLPENAVVFRCNGLTDSTFTGRLYSVVPGKVADTLDSLQL